MRHLINDNWIFREFDKETAFETVNNMLENDRASFNPVDVPHDWMIYDTKDLYRSSVGVYVRRLDLDSSKHNAVYFEGVYMRTHVYLNGEEIFFWPYGYTSFEVDLTPYQRDGDNELLVYVDYRYPNTRWYSGAGIFRDVWLISTEHTRLVTDGIYFSAFPSENSGNTFSVTIDTEAVADRAGVNDGLVLIRHTLTDKEGNEAACSSSEQTVYAEPSVNTQSFKVDGITRWDIDDPYLYELRTELCTVSEDGVVVTVDTCTQRVGFREISFSPDSGFFLNGRHVKLHGACQHHDLGALGAAFNKKAAGRQIEKLKSIGVNSIRTSHNPPAVGLMELADEMGILIDSEAFDMWEQPKTENDYGIFFHDWCERDVEAWVRRDRNHPSVIMWSCGNEIPDTNNTEAVAIAERLRNAVRRCDYRHNAYTTIGSNMVAWDNAQKSQDVFEVSGYNYLESVYDEHHVKFPHWCIYGSETASTVQSRGIYHFPKSNRMLTYEDMQCSCLDNCSTNWGAKGVHRFITDDRDRDFCAGQYIWTGWDYIGEPTPYFSKNSFFGHIDTAGFYKDTAYIIKAGWVAFDKEPFVHIAPYWDFNEGQLIDIDVYSNAPKVALFYNDELIGEKELDQEHDAYYSASFSMPYRKGILTAVAYDTDGRVAAKEETGSFGDPCEISLKAEYESIRADGEDLQFIEVTVVDKDGNEVRNARNRIKINVSGPARLVGMDNGDSTDYEQYKASSRKLFSGKLVAVIAATEKAGEICVTATSEGLPDKRLVFESCDAEHREGISCDYDILTDEGASDDFSGEIPIRKLTLTCDREDRELTPESPSVRLSVKVEPDNATYRDIQFKAVNSDGIISRAVEIEAQGPEALITAQHDGDFRLVASAGNGKEHAEILSELEFSVSGLGEAVLDPYDFVYGCQYAVSSKTAELSFRGSVKTEDDNVISFNDVDFGEYGSDEIHLSIFTFRDEEYVEIWDGEPEDGELLFAGNYAIPTQYNVLQEDTFRLSRRLTGTRGITFKLEHGVVLGGFRMTKQEKAYGRLCPTEYSMITGDTYEERSDGIYSIGNNVDIGFSNMNFTDGVSSVTITGRARKAANPIHIRFFKGDEVIKRMVEFPVTEEPETITFSIDGFSGSGRVDFIFLPGSDFDFKEFQFAAK